MWSGLENRLVANADDATRFAPVSSPHMRPIITKSLNKDLSKISAWCNLWCMKMNPTKTQCMTVSRSRTAFLSHPDLFIDDVPLTMCDSFEILGVIFDSKVTFEQHLCSVSSSVVQKIGLLRNFFKVFGYHSVVKSGLIPLFCLVWRVVHLFGVLQQTLLFSCWVGI